MGGFLLAAEVGGLVTLRVSIGCEIRGFLVVARARGLVTLRVSIARESKRVGDLEGF